MTQSSQLRAARETGCQLMKRIARETEAHITRLRERQQDLNEELDRLQAAADPDEAQIKMIKQALTSVQADLEQSEAALADIQIDISMNCSG